MQKAFILINAELGKLWKIADSIKEIAEVKIASAVTGTFELASGGESNSSSWRSSLPSQRAR